MAPDGCRSYVNSRCSVVCRKDWVWGDSRGGVGFQREAQGQSQGDLWVVGLESVRGLGKTWALLVTWDIVAIKDAVIGQSIAVWVLWTRDEPRVWAGAGSHGCVGLDTHCSLTLQWSFFTWVRAYSPATMLCVDPTWKAISDAAASSFCTAAYFVLQHRSPLWCI